MIWILSNDKLELRYYTKKVDLTKKKITAFLLHEIYLFIVALINIFNLQFAGIQIETQWATYVVEYSIARTDTKSDCQIKMLENIFTIEIWIL